MKFAQGECLQDEEVKGALKEVSLLAHCHL
jgi:hypothetical protein